MKQKCTLIICCFSLFAFISCNNKKPSREEAKIKLLYDQWGDAVASRDLDRIMSFYSTYENAVFYDAFPPREYKGAAAYRKDYQNFFTAFPGPLRSQVSNLQIHASADMAYAFGIDTWAVTGQDQRITTMVFRFTDVLEKQNGKWLIVHEHLSFPVDPVSGQADFMSKP